MRFSEGQIVYFKKKLQARYSTGTYDFIPGHRYKVNQIGTSNSYTITNLEDDSSHFLLDYHYKELVNISEWRNLKIEEIIYT